jgi:undecaprenol kinase/diacylglycerol kinase (ATP)
MAQTFKYAFAGIGYTIRSQRNMKVHLAIAALALFASAFLQLTVFEWAVIIILIGLVFTGEMLNTAIEAIVDLLSPEFHPLAKVAKDVGAGMVLILAIVSVISGVLIYGSALLRLVG